MQDNGYGYGIGLTITVIEGKGYCFAGKSPLIHANLVPMPRVRNRKEKTVCRFYALRSCNHCESAGLIAFRLENTEVSGA